VIGIIAGESDRIYPGDLLEGRSRYIDLNLKISPVPVMTLAILVAIMISIMFLDLLSLPLVEFSRDEKVVERGFATVQEADG